MEYEVAYRIDVEADNAVDAALKTADILTAGHWRAEGGVYEVRPAGGDAGVLIDLSGENEEQELPASSTLREQLTQLLAARGTGESDTVVLEQVTALVAADSCP